LADVVAQSDADLFNQNDRLVWLNEGSLVPVNRDILLELIPKHVSVKKLVNRDGRWERELCPFVRRGRYGAPWYSGYDSMPILFRDGATSERGFASSKKRPLRRPVKRSVAALLTGSSRQRLNGFIGRTQSRVGLDGPRFVIPRQSFVPRCHGGNFPCRAFRVGKLGPLRPSILNGNLLNPVDARWALPPAYPPPQTCLRPMVLQRKSNAGTMNRHRSSGDERAIADT
jgi:hypothetical protein